MWVGILAGSDDFPSVCEIKKKLKIKLFYKSLLSIYSCPFFIRFFNIYIFLLGLYVSAHIDFRWITSSRYIPLPKKSITTNSIGILTGSELKDFRML